MANILPSPPVGVTSSSNEERRIKKTFYDEIYRPKPTIPRELFRSKAPSNRRPLETRKDYADFLNDPTIPLIERRNKIGAYSDMLLKACKAQDEAIKDAPASLYNIAQADGLKIKIEALFFPINLIDDAGRIIPNPEVQEDNENTSKPQQKPDAEFIGFLNTMALLIEMKEYDAAKGQIAAYLKNPENSISNKYALLGPYERTLLGIGKNIKLSEAKSFMEKEIANDQLKIKVDDIHLLLGVFLPDDQKRRLP